MKLSAPSPSRRKERPVRPILLILLLTTLSSGCVGRPKVVVPIPPAPLHRTNPLEEGCSTPVLSGDVFRDLIATEEARLCERADKAGLRAERDALLKAQTRPQRSGLRGLLPF